MKKMVIDEGFWNIFPDAKIGVVVVKGIDNSEKDAAYFTEELQKAKKNARQFLKKDTFSENEVIQIWRTIYSQFKTKKGARSSIEALLKRVQQDRNFEPINPLVDIYNAISLTFGLPCGGEDIATIQGDLHLGKAQGEESFRPLGDDKDSPALPEEIIYYDKAGAICRCLNWRETQRTMLTADTKDAVLVLEAIYPTQYKQLENAHQKLSDDIQSYFACDTTMHWLTKENPIVTISE